MKPFFSECKNNQEKHSARRRNLDKDYNFIDTRREKEDARGWSNKPQEEELPYRLVHVILRVCMGMDKMMSITGRTRPEFCIFFGKCTNSERI